MNGRNIGIVFCALLVLLMPLASAGVQVVSYSISPSVLKPGMSGTITITFNNPSTTEFVTDAYLSGSASGIQFTSGNRIGDLGALGTTLVSVPFNVQSSATPGMVSATLTLGYTSSLSGASNSKVFSVPITIAATTLLKVTDVRISQESVKPGDSFTLEATIENSGGAIRNSYLSYTSTAAFTFEGTTKIDVGDLNTGEKRRITIPILAGNSMTAGYYSVPFALNFDDPVTAGNNETLYFGPITAVTDYEIFSITAQTEDATPGGKGIFRIIVKNTGTFDLRNFKIGLQSATFFTPLDFTEKTIDLIRVGDTRQVEFEVGIGTNIVAQVYPLPLTITYQTKSGSQTVTKSVGVRIGGAPDLSLYISSNPAVITNDNKPYSISIQVSNTGNTPVRALAVKANSKELEILSPKDAFIGTLSLDDYSTVQYDAVIKKGVAPGHYNIEIELSYKDSYNQPHLEKKMVGFQIFSQELALVASKQSGNNPLVMVVVVIIVGVAAYFIYKRFFKSKMSQTLKLK
ncbi:MAG: hypothetical protein ABIG96_04115 [Candidatus Micrarchaeota archaeon]